MISRLLLRLVQCTIACSLTLFAAPRAAAQHDGHGTAHTMPGDTLASAPVTPSRTVRDSAHVADSLLSICHPHVAHSIDAYSTCIGDGIAALSSRGNIALAMGTLDVVVHRDPSLVLLGHPLAHALGYAVRSTPATATKLLEQCDDRYQSGCYHGILQRYFDTRADMPLAQDVLVAPCDGLRGTKEQFRLFDCLHGTGHGLMMYRRYDVNQSLKDCDRLRSEWDQRSCYSGVFMEHNMGARMQVFGDGSFGMHRHVVPSSSVTLYKPNDLHYPCDSTAPRYRHECYELQPDLILPAVKQDYAKAGKVCDGAGSPGLVQICYAGLGRNASGAAAFGFAGIKKRCDLGSTAGVPFCYAGAARHLAYAPSELPRGVAFCKSLPDGPVRAQCWDAIGLQVSGFYSDAESRRKACATERADDAAACNEGAGVAPLVTKTSKPD